jgi:hypothetical protein
MTAVCKPSIFAEEVMRTACSCRSLSSFVPRPCRRDYPSIDETKCMSKQAVTVLLPVCTLTHIYLKPSSTPNTSLLLYIHIAIHAPLSINAICSTLPGGKLRNINSH